MARGALLWCLLLALFGTPCLAVTCDSYKTEEKCTGLVDGTNLCSWDGDTCVTTSETLGEGMVGITSVVVDEAKAEGLLNDSFCSLPPDDTDGLSCMAYFEVYYYNETTQSCELYVYGGCGATENQFGTKEACENAAATYCGFEASSTPSPTDGAINATSPMIPSPSIDTVDPTQAIAETPTTGAVYVPSEIVTPAAPPSLSPSKMGFYGIALVCFSLLLSVMQY